jgi:hypothetical protein
MILMFCKDLERLVFLALDKPYKSFPFLFSLGSLYKLPSDVLKFYLINVIDLIFSGAILSPFVPSVFLAYRVKQ